MGEGKYKKVRKERKRATRKIHRGKVDLKSQAMSLSSSKLISLLRRSSATKEVLIALHGRHIPLLVVSEVCLDDLIGLAVYFLVLVRLEKLDLV